MIQSEESGSPGTPAPALARGEVLAARYRVVSFLGRGAVGEVYEAADLELGEPVAIKVLRPEIAGDERVLQRFKREIQLARRVTHPNVCRVYDLIYDLGKAEAGSQPLHVFLTMELLRGETLEQRLAREGRLSTAETLPIVGHVAAALSAAHAQGIVHRDLKSGNIFLVPTPAGSRAVVTDFGLAWSTLHADDSSATLTATGELVGSPAYMAPEQVRGEEATPATDIYALGVVIFEMVTGELPFVGKSAFYTALKRLQEPPPSPRLQVSDLDPAWEATILRCLAREPAARFPSARHVVRSLGRTKAEEDATSPLALLGAPQRRRPWPASILGVASLILLVSVLWLAKVPPFSRPVPEAEQAASTPAPKPASAFSPRPVIAVLGFAGPAAGVGVPGADLGAALAEMLPLQLAAAETLRVVPADLVDLAKRELGVRDAAGLPAGLTAETLARLRSRLGADFLVSGSWTVDDQSRLRLEVVVQDARIGETVAAFAETTAESDFPALLTGLGERLRARFGAGRLPASAAEAARAALPSSLAGADQLTRGLAPLRSFDAPAARILLHRAAAAEPDSPFVHAALAESWVQSGDQGRARREAKRAWDLARRLRPAQRREMEARYREMVPDGKAAVSIYQELLATHPDDLEVGLRLAAAQTAIDRSADAAETLKQLRRLPPPSGDDPRLLLAEAAAAGQRAENALQRDLAARAARSGEELGAQRLVVDALLLEAAARQAVRDLPGALGVAERAERLAAEAAYRPALGAAIRTRATLVFLEAGWEKARPIYDRAFVAFREAGDEGGRAWTLKEIGGLRSTAGDTAGAEASLREALAAMQQLGDRRGVADVLHNLGRTAQQRGDTAEARRLFEQALALQREIGYERAEAKTLQGLAFLASQQGEMEQALRHHERALTLARASADRRGPMPVLFNRASVQFQMGDLAGARRSREEALAISREIEDQVGIARGLRGLAELDRHEGDLAAARGLYGQALAIYRRLGMREDEASVLNEIGVTLTLQGEFGKAVEMLAAPLAYCREKSLSSPEAAVLVSRARAQWGRGDLAAARADLEAGLAVGGDKAPKNSAEARVVLALVHRDLGDLAAARREAEGALAAFRAHRNPQREADALFALGTILALQGDRDAARLHHEQARDIRVRMGERLAVAESERALSELSRQTAPGT